MNEIGIGIFCFGDEHYYNGTNEKLNHFIDCGINCYLLTEKPEFFENKNLLHIIEYDRNYKSYHDKIRLVKSIFKNHNIAILIDADTHIKDYSFFKNLNNFDFKKGISFIDTLENHPSKKEFVKDLINQTNEEWIHFLNYVKSIYNDFDGLKTIWEYFLIFNKDGFNYEFFRCYEKLQIAKEYSDLKSNKFVSGAGEGISLSIASHLSGIQLERDLTLYHELKDTIISISKKHTPKFLWPKWMM